MWEGTGNDTGCRILSPLTFTLQVIVAVDEEELPRLKQLYERGVENGVRDLRLIGAEELKQLEPHCRVRTVTILQ